MADLNQLLNNAPAQQPTAPQAQPVPQAPPQPQYAQPAQPIQQAPPQPQYQAPPQAPPVGGEQAQGPAPLVGGMSQYAQASSGLFARRNTNAPRIYFDCEGTYIVQLERLTTGVSTNPNKNAGRPFLGANFKILRTDFCAVDVSQTQVRDGVEVSWMTWLPRNAQYMTVEDEFNLVDALTLLSSVLGLKQADENGNPYIDLSIADQMCADDGAIVKGRIFGVQVVGKPGKGKDGAEVIYHNARFFPVDANMQRHDGYTPQQIQQMNAGG